MSTTAAATSLMLTLEQIIEGEGACDYCRHEAVATVSTGADPQPAPVCATHARQWLDATYRLTKTMWGDPEAGA